MQGSFKNLVFKKNRKYLRRKIQNSSEELEKQKISEKCTNLEEREEEDREEEKTQYIIRSDILLKKIAQGSRTV